MAGISRNEALAELARRGTKVPETPGSTKLTEDQGKSASYARLMAKAEENYQRALKDGYNPRSLRNAFASVAEDAKLPWIGNPFKGAGPLIRNDVSDRGAAAEKLWGDAQLKAMTGAGQSDREQARSEMTYFPGFGDSAASDKEAVRRAAFEAARVRAGPAATSIPGYPTGMQRPSTSAPDPLGIRRR